jgi:DNA invertase Pin-like site-specific DNA recombinase
LFRERRHVPRHFDLLDLPPINQVASGVRIPVDERRGMARKRYTPEEVIQPLRTIELDTGKGLAVLDVCRKLGITEQTYYRWKKE